MNDVVEMVERTAQSYAKVLREKWDDMPAKRQDMFRQLAFFIYEMHIKNKLNGMSEALQVIQQVQQAPSTPKRWLPGVQEAANAVGLYIADEVELHEIAVEVPETVPDDLTKADPYSHLTAEDTDPYGGCVPSKERCGALHDENWTCTRPVHPSHWQHWDSDPEDFYKETGTDILVTWNGNGEIRTIHRAVLEYEDGGME